MSRWCKLNKIPLHQQIDSTTVSLPLDFADRRNGYSLSRMPVKEKETKAYLGKLSAGQQTGVAMKQH
jgi:hypothetical protein